MIQEQGATVTHVAFPESGLLFAVLKSDQMVGVEIGICGAEGQSGAAGVLVGLPWYPVVTDEVAGSDFLLPAEVLRDEWSRGGTLQHLVVQHMDTVTTQMAHGIMCNRLHTLEERLSRWLLLIQDLVGGDTFEPANLFIAALLGVRLSGVPVALGALQQAGFISRTETHIIIIDRPQLEASACECYAALHHRYKLWEQSLASVLSGKS